MFTSIKESEFFFSHLKKDFRVLEYGSGQSTIEIGNLTKEVISIEHQRNWYDQMSMKIPGNVKIILKLPNVHYVEGADCGTYDQFKDYINEGRFHGMFDVIFIDGRARIECAKICNEISHENTIIFIHDFRSRYENYKLVLDHLTLISEVEDMAMFKIKKQL